MFNSIRIKLTVWYVGVLALVIIAFAALTYFTLVRALSRDLDLRLMEMARNFTAALEAEQADEADNPAGENAVLETANEMHFRDYQFLVLANDNRVVASTMQNDLPNNIEFNSTYGNAKTENDVFRIYASPLNVRQNQYRLLVFHSVKEQKTLENQLTKVFSIAVPLALLLAAFGGYFLARKSLAPMVEMSSQAANISANNLHERISIKNKRDELGNLAEVFNRLLERLDASFQQQRQFMADASHELRTPLAIVRGESEVALSKDNRATGDYRESLHVVHDESKRLTKIIEDLFTLARADAGQFQIKFAPVYLDEIVQDAVRSMRVLAKQKKVDLNFSCEAEMPFSADESLLHRLFLNLLDNAVKYNHAGGTVSVVCELSNENYRVKIADSGIGIPPPEQKNIFERFYRVDKARSRAVDTATSGAGLGLSIANWIAELHQGIIELESSDEKGSVFSVMFPRLK